MTKSKDVVARLKGLSVGEGVPQKPTPVQIDAGIACSGDKAITLCSLEGVDLGRAGSRSFEVCGTPSRTQAQESRKGRLGVYYMA